MTLVTSELLPHTIELPVDDDCLRRGLRKEPALCPIALALRKLYPLATYISVGPGTACMIFSSPRGESRVLYDLGVLGRNFIGLFDNGDPASPATLYLTRTYRWKED